jgi:integrase
MARPRLTAASLRAAAAESAPYDLRSDALPGLLCRVEVSGRKTFYVQVARGKRVRLGDARILTLGEAVEQARRVQVDPAAYLRAKVRGDDLHTFLKDQYLPWRRAKYPKTADETERRLKRHFEKDFYALPLQEVTAPAVERWVAKRLQAGTSEHTVERDVAELRAVLSRAVAVGALDANPLKGMAKHRKTDNTKIRFLAPDEEARLRTALGKKGRPAHLVAIVLTAMNTGLRRGELTTLQRSDIDLDARLLTVRAAAAKGKRPRTIPLNDEAHGALSRWLEANPRKPGEVVFGVLDVKKAFATLLKDAKVTDFWFHALRHHFASKLVQKGVPLNTVRALMGHATLAMTLRYAHLAPGDLADAVAKL